MLAQAADTPDLPQADAGTKLLPFFRKRVLRGASEHRLQVLLHLPERLEHFSEWSVRVNVRKAIGPDRLTVAQEHSGDLPIDQVRAGLAKLAEAQREEVGMVLANTPDQCIPGVG